MSDPLPSKPLPDFTHGKSRKSFFKKNLRFLRYVWVRWALVLSFLAITGLVVAPKVYSKLKTLRAREQMSKFDEAMAQGKIEEASKFLMVAQMLRPESPDVQRGVRVINAAQGVPAALDAIQRLMLQDTVTPEELLIVSEQALNRNMTEVAREALGKLGPETSTRRTILEIRLKHLDGKNAEAVELAQYAASSCGNTEDADKILLEGGMAAMEENAEASRDILLSLSKKTTPTGLTALRLLTSQALKNPQDAALPPHELAEQIKAHPLRDGNDLLAAANLELASDPSQQKALVKSLMLERATAEKPDALALAYWLISHQEYQSAIDFIREKRAVSEDVWFFPYLVALARLENWEEMNSFLRSWNLPLTAPSLRLLFLAHAAEKNGDGARAKGLWSELEIRCINEPAPFARLLVETAAKFGHPEEAKRLAWALARNKETSAEGFRLVINQQPTSSSSREWIPIYQEMLEYLPDSPIARRGLAYHQLMVEENVPKAAEVALEEHKKSANKRATCHLAALALLRLGEIAQADALLAGIAPPKERTKWIESLRNHPKSTPGLLLAADSAEAASDPAAAPILAAKVFSRLEKSPAGERRAGFLWLARHGQPERALRLLTRDEAIAAPDSFTAWIEALAATGQAEKIPEALDLPANLLPAYRSALYRARALQLLGRSAESAQAYQAAIAASSGNPSESLRTLAFLYNAGETALFETELQKNLSAPDTARPALEALQPVVAKRRDIGALRHFHTLALAAPGVLNKTQVQNEIDYCDLVLGRPVEIAPLAELARRNPDNLQFRTTHALALFRAGENAQALSELSSPGDPAENPALLARHAAVQALALTASADPVEATKTLAALNPLLLTQQEAALIRSTRATPEATASLVERTKTTPAGNRLFTAALLARQKDFDAALALVSLDEAIAKPGTFLPWLDACAATGRWNETLAALSRSDNPLPAHTSALFTGIALKNLRKLPEARDAFDSALAASADDPAKFTSTLAALFQARETELFEKNLATLEGRPDLARAAIKNLLPAIQAQRDSALTLRFYELTAAALPDLFQQPGTQNDLAYLHLILGQSTPLEPLKQRAAAEPSNLSALATLALAQLQKGDAPAALAAFAEFRPGSDFQNLPPRIKAIYAATLAANGQKDPAARIAASIPPESLSLQEAEWLKARIP